MCLVTGDPRIRAAEHGELLRAIWGTLAQQIASSGDYGVVMDQTFAPVRVICEPDGRLTAVFPYPADGDELRIGVINRLPRRVANPCVRPLQGGRRVGPGHE